MEMLLIYLALTFGYLGISELYLAARMPIRVRKVLSVVPIIHAILLIFYVVIFILAIFKVILIIKIYKCYFVCINYTMNDALGFFTDNPALFHIHNMIEFREFLRDNLKQPLKVLTIIVSCKSLTNLPNYKHWVDLYWDVNIENFRYR